MRRQLSACVGLFLLVATSAWAQLSSQTALVGTVTDSGGSVVPGAQVVAVNAGTKDTYVIVSAKGTASSIKIRDESGREQVLKP